MKKLVIDGMEVAVQKKRIKNLYLRVEPTKGQVRVSVPYGVPEQLVCAFVSSRKDWIRMQQEKLLGRAGERVKEYADGTTVYLWGESCTLQIKKAEEEKVMLQGSTVILLEKDGGTAGQRQEILEQWYRAQMEEALPELIAKCGEITGLSADEWKIWDMKTRWGTCNVLKKRIWLNLQLAKRPKEYLEYVMLHELTHLLEEGHTPVFYGYMDRFCPGWRAIRKHLNEEIYD